MPRVAKKKTGDTKEEKTPKAKKVSTKTPKVSKEEVISKLRIRVQAY